MRRHGGGVLLGCVALCAVAPSHDARLALRLGDFAGGHFDRDLGAALLRPRVARQRRRG